ncbi:hypothetical protein QQ045_002992 [Rhodiola kirilowii]
MNKLWHNKEGVDLQVVISQVLRTVKELSQMKHMFIISRPESGHRWEPQEEGELKISCDGAWNLDTKEAGLGVVCRDCSGRVQFVAATFLQHQTTITKVEGQAVQLGMRLARDLKMNKVTFESDNIEVVQALISQSKLTMRGWSTVGSKINVGFLNMSCERRTWWLTCWRKRRGRKDGNGNRLILFQCSCPKLFVQTGFLQVLALSLLFWCLVFIFFVIVFPIKKHLFK